jgi:tetratricopeptide (TPR) repeat protein
MAGHCSTERAGTEGRCPSSCDRMNAILESRALPKLLEFSRLNRLKVNVMRPPRWSVLCVPLLYLALASEMIVNAQPRPDHEHLAMKGFDLSAEEAKELQKQSDADPEDLESRIPLLTYYFGESYQSPDAKKSHQELALWFIEKHPELEITGDPQAGINQHLNPEGYAKAKSLWLANIDKHKNNARVLSHAARFFLLPDKTVAEDLLKKAQSLEPENPQWSMQLGHLYELSSNHAPDEARKTFAGKALVEYERALNQQKQSDEKFFLLPDLATVAFNAGDFAKAKKYADELLKMSDEIEKNWNSGNAVHHGNLVLGRVALRKGDVDKAKSYLLAAGKTEGSPQLNSFGPNMTLAKELLEKGEKETVLEYFDLCGKFWEREELDQWRATVKGDGIPEFGANLSY